MQNLQQIKQELRDALPIKGLSFLIKSLKEFLPDHSPKYNILIGLEAEYRQLNLDSFANVLSRSEQELRHSQLRQRSLELLMSLEAEDFDPSIRHSRLTSGGKVRRGHVLYRIPKEMQLGEETRCLVRIAFDQEMLLENLQLDKHLELRSEVRISDYMKVEITDPAAEPVFVIRTTSEPVQFIDEDDFTEWRFYVKPLRPGEHTLELKVCIMLQINGEDRIRERTLEESVVIVAEKPVQQEEDFPFTKMEDNLVLPSAVESLMPQPMQTTKRGGGASAILPLALVIITGVIAYAIGPQAFREQIDWLSTRYLKNNEGAFLAFADKYPDGNHLGDALWEVASISEEPEDYLAYVNLDGVQSREPEAISRIEQMESRVWADANSAPTPLSLDRYLRLYPDGSYRQEAILQLAKAESWQASRSSTVPERWQVDTLGWQERMLAYAVESQGSDTGNAILQLAGRLNGLEIEGPNDGRNTPPEDPGRPRMEVATPDFVIVDPLLRERPISLRINQNFPATELSAVYRNEDDLPTVMADRVRRMEVKFGLKEVTTEYQGLRTIYLSITDDRQLPVASENPKTVTVPVEGREIEVFAVMESQVIIGDDQVLSLSYELTGELKPGPYRIVLSSDVGIMGTAFNILR